jgi:hypothetical protein
MTFFPPPVGALAPDVSAPTHAVPRAADKLGATFFVRFIGLAEATSTWNDRFVPTFTHDTMIFSYSTFFFLEAFARLVDVFPMTSAFLFFEASV